MAARVHRPNTGSVLGAAAMSPPVSRPSPLPTSIGRGGFRPRRNSKEDEEKGSSTSSSNAGSFKRPNLARSKTDTLTLPHTSHLGFQTPPGGGTPLRMRPERQPLDYSSVESLWQALSADASGIRPLSANWLLALAQTYGVAGYRAKKGKIAMLPRCQDCPPEAFLSVQELARMYEESPNNHTMGPLPQGGQEPKRAPFISISLLWHTEEHPDPEGELMNTLGLALRQVSAPHLRLTPPP